MKKEIFITKSNKIHKNKYNYDKTIYKCSHEKVTITCPVHGDFSQLPTNHLQGKGCSQCGIKNTQEKLSLTKEEFVKKANQVHNDKYNYKEVNYINARTKVKIICPKHNIFKQLPYIHLNGSICPKCHFEKLGLDRRSTEEEFIEKAKIVHGNRYEYPNIKYKNNFTKINIKCIIHGNFKQSPSGHLQGQGCPICKASKGELAIKAILDKHNIKYIREYRIPDENYLLYYDFYLPDHNLLIEFHGKQHYEWIPYFQKTYYIFEQQKLRDNNKIDLAKMKNISLLEFNYRQLNELSTEQFRDLVLMKLSERRTK